MSDDLRKAINELREDLTGVKTELHAAKAAISGAARRFDTFLVRFEETTEMMV